MNNDIKEILEFNKNADYKRLSVDEIIVIKDYITNLQEENDYLKDIVSNTELSDEIKKADKWSKRELYKINYQRLLVNQRLIEENQRLKKYNKICKKYLHNHERDYVDELGSICCKPSEYFNIAWAQDILNGDIEGFEDLLQGSDK